MKYCVIIPTYNNDKTLEGVLSEVLKITRDIIVVNDGSSDGTSQILQRFDGLKAISYSPNKGKGYAMRKGFELAAAAGYNYAITMDSDGQHYAVDIPVFISRILEKPDALIVGARNLTRERYLKGQQFRKPVFEFLV